MIELRRRVSCFALVLLAACTSTRESGRAGDEKVAAPPPVETPKTSAGERDCQTEIAEYLLARSSANECQSDDDCAEIWPGLCPHGPYYINRDSDVAPLFAIEREIAERCGVPDCEPPMELGMASCSKGRCERGRSPPTQNDHESCWDYRETYLEADGATNGSTATKIQGITPHLVVVPKSAGTLRLFVDFPADCKDCTLMISRSSGMSQPVEPTLVKTEDTQVNGDPVRRSHLELPVIAAPFHMIPRAGAAVPYSLRIELVDGAGKPGAVTRHGIGWIGMCEG